LWRTYYHSLGIKRRVSRFLPITPGAKAWLKDHLRLAEGEMSISPLGVDLQSFSYDETAETEFRRAHGVGDKLVIVNAGKQYPGKRLEWVIEVFQAALERGVDAFLVLVGNAEEGYARLLSEKLKGLEGRFLRLPLLPAEALQKVYSAADVGIWPGVPSVTIQESMACGAALILPDDDIVGQLIDGNGLRESRDAARAAAFIGELAADTGKLERMKNRSIVIAKGYDWRAIAGELMSLYAQ
jgi:glycosyltransferase involved in cell wall biosynthesis